MRLGPLRAALRIARRDAWRARGRSALVVAMIALPVLGVTAADVLARTFQLDPAERVTRELGAADAAVRWEYDGPVVQPPDQSEPLQTEDVVPRLHTAAQLRAALPAGSRMLLDRSAGPVTVRTAAGLTEVELRELDYGDPMARGILRPVAGHAPRTAAEVALTPALAKKTGLSPGQQLRLTEPAAASYTVAGVVEDPQSLDAEVLYARPGTVPAGAGGGFGDAPQTWLVDTPNSLTWSDVLALNKRGVTAVSRAVLLDPPAPTDVPFYQSAGGEPDTRAEWVVMLTVTLVVGMALLEVVLLAGPAFAVGARRQRRQLALVVAAGGSARTVRAIVLAGGVVLGAAGAAVGIAAGVVVVAALRPSFEAVAGFRSGALDVRIAEVGGVALLAVAIGLLAAAVPAWSASRQNTVEALAGRRGIARSRRRYVVAGAVLAAGGAALAIGSAALPASQSTARTVPLLAGIVAAEFGAVLCTPAILGAVARFGRWLPLAPRIALRDTARNRASAAPAVAAIMAAVAGTVAIGLNVASEDALDRARYQPALPPGHASVTFQTDEPETRAVTSAVVAAVERTLPVDGVYPVSTMSGFFCDGDSCATVRAEIPVGRTCPLELPSRTPPSTSEYGKYRSDPRCAGHLRQGDASYVVGDGTALGALTGEPAAHLTAARRALQAGGVVVGDPRAVVDGTVTLVVTRTDESSAEPPQTATRLTVPGSVLETDPRWAGGMVSPTLAHKLAAAGVRFDPPRVVADTTRTPTGSEEEAALQAVRKVAAGTYLYVERGHQTETPLLLLALTVVGAVVTLGAAAIATGLAAADGRADLVTLAAVGASPRIRRLLALCQAGVVAGLGTVLGVVAGFVAGGAIVLTLASYDLSGYAWSAGGPESRSLVSSRCSTSRLTIRR